MRIGILGSGLMGAKLGTLFARAGHRVTFSYSHDFRKLEKLARNAGRGARAGTPAEAAGTWCPNCHDEAQYLIQLDKKYRDKGLAIVALNFEEVEQQDSLERVHAFIKQYGVKYTYLNAGAPEEMWEKVPQLVNLNTWPATVFVGRDGTVRAVHAGFASPATGDFYSKQQQEFTQRIESLLAEKAGDVRVTQVSASGDSATRNLK